MSHDIIVLIAGCSLWAFGLLCGTLLERNRNTKVCTHSASYNTGIDDISQQYHELLYSVEQKFPNETRHQTALRYIQQTERNLSGKIDKISTILEESKKDTRNIEEETNEIAKYKWIESEKANVSGDWN